MSDPQYDTEFWFNATLYTAYDWHGDFNTVEDAREAFDAWLNSIRAEGWDAAVSSMIYDDGTTVEIAHNVNPFRRGT